jgi:hypothetical protein
MSEVYYLGKGLCMRAEPSLRAGGWAAPILLIFIYIKIHDCQASILRYK